VQKAETMKISEERLASSYEIKSLKISNTDKSWNNMAGHSNSHL
jgi:hypothetical protein